MRGAPSGCPTPAEEPARQEDEANNDGQDDGERARRTPVGIGGDGLLDLDREGGDVAPAQELRRDVKAQAEHEGEERARDQPLPGEGQEDVAESPRRTGAEA